MLDHCLNDLTTFLVGLSSVQVAEKLEWCAFFASVPLTFEFSNVTLHVYLSHSEVSKYEWKEHPKKLTPPYSCRVHVYEVPGRRRYKLQLSKICHLSPSDLQNSEQPFDFSMIRSSTLRKRKRRNSSKHDGSFKTFVWGMGSYGQLGLGDDK